VDQASHIAWTVSSTANEPMLGPCPIAESLAYVLLTDLIAGEGASAA